MKKLEMLLLELAKTTLNCLENQSDIFLTFRFSPNNKTLDCDLQLPAIGESYEEKQKLSKNIAILVYLLTFGQCNEQIALFLENNNNPIIKQALNELNNIVQAIVEQEETEQEERDGIKLMDDGSIDPTAAIKIDSL